MIVLDFCPTLVREYSVDEFQIGDVNKCTDAKVYPGGIGVNVSRILNNVGEKHVLVTLLGGTKGEKLKSLMQNNNYKYVKLKDNTTEEVRIVAGDKVTEIFTQNPRVTREAQNEFVEAVQRELLFANYLIIPKFVENNMPYEIVKKLILGAQRGKVKTMVAYPEDISDILKEKPDVLFVSGKELEGYFNLQIHHQSQALQIGRGIVDKYLDILFIKSEADYVLAIFKDEAYKISTPMGREVDGNAFLAGYGMGMKRKYDIETTLKLAAGFGISAKSEEIEKINMGRIKEIMNLSQVSKL